MSREAKTITFAMSCLLLVVEKITKVMSASHTGKGCI